MNILVSILPLLCTSGWGEAFFLLVHDLGGGGALIVLLLDAVEQDDFGNWYDFHAGCCGCLPGNYLFMCGA